MTTEISYTRKLAEFSCDVTFADHSLATDSVFSETQLISCRNVLIYFLPELQNYVLSQFAFSLHANGYLFLGKAETVRPNQIYYELVNKHWKIYRYTGAEYTSSVLPLQHLSPLAAARFLEISSRSVHEKSAIGNVGASQAQELLQLRHFNELLLRFLPVGIVVIDRTYRIVIANGEALTVMLSVLLVCAVGVPLSLTWILPSTVLPQMLTLSVAPLTSSAPLSVLSKTNT